MEWLADLNWLKEDNEGSETVIRICAKGFNTTCDEDSNTTCDDDSNTTCDEDTNTTCDEDSNTTCDEDSNTTCDEDSNTTCGDDSNTTCEEDWFGTEEDESEGEWRGRCGHNSVPTKVWLLISETSSIPRNQGGKWCYQ